MPLRPNGVPGSGPGARPALRARSAARGARGASSARTRTKLLRRPSCAAMRARQASTRAAEVTRPAARARLAAIAVSGAVPESTLMVGPEDEIELVRIGEVARDERDQLAHGGLRLLGLAPRDLVEMVEGGFRLFRHRIIAPALRLCVLRDGRFATSG